MSGKPNEPKDLPIPNTVDANSIRERLKTNNIVSQFAKEGKKLLEETNKPNVITVAEFTPYIPLFQMGEKELERYEKDEDYKLSMNRLYNNYIRGLGINLYEPTIVIRSREDPVEELVLNRKFTRIRGDNTEGRSQRDNVPAAITRNASMTRDQLILDASVKDLIAANQAPEMKQYFARMKMQSAIIEKRFVEKNMSPDKRPNAVKSSEETTDTSSHWANTVTLVDDDD